MIAVMEIWFRMLPTLSSVAKDGLAMEKKATRNSRVMKGAMLLSRPRSQLITADWFPLPARAVSVTRALIWVPCGRLEGE